MSFLDFEILPKVKERVLRAKTTLGIKAETPALDKIIEKVSTVKARVKARGAPPAPAPAAQFYGQVVPEEEKPQFK
jgi:hypothetical protein